MCLQFSFNIRNRNILFDDNITNIKTKYLKKNYENDHIDNSNFEFEKKTIVNLLLNFNVYIINSISHFKFHFVCRTHT